MSLRERRKIKNYHLTNMPYKSLAQERYFYANKKKLEKQGVNVNEWDKATKGLKLPKKVKPKKKND